MAFISESSSDSYRRGESASRLRSAEKLNAPLRTLDGLRRHLARNLAAPAADPATSPGWFLGQITRNPAGQADYSDERYWVTAVRPTLAFANTHSLPVSSAFSVAHLLCHSAIP